MHDIAVSTPVASAATACRASAGDARRRGDRTLIIGAVENVGFVFGGAPLLYRWGLYFVPASERMIA